MHCPGEEIGIASTVCSAVAGFEICMLRFPTLLLHLKQEGLPVRTCYVHTEGRCEEVYVLTVSPLLYVRHYQHTVCIVLACNL
jgi:hypothetical protein